MEPHIKDNLIKDLSLDLLPEEDQEQALLTVGRIIFQSVLIRVLERLSEKEKTEFEKILKEKQDDEEAVYAFLQEKIPNLNDVVTEEVAKFKTDTSEMMKGMKV